MNVHDFKRMKIESRKISMVTCYDHWSARILAATEIDCLLVGDSVAMVMHGHPTTLQATTEMMATHTAAVARGAPGKFVVSDMPFLSYRGSSDRALDCVAELMRAGAQAVKLEGVHGHATVISRIVESGVPVMGHIGLTPQSIHGLGGFRVQGREDEAARDLLLQARRLQDLGCFALVLECVPSELASQIAEQLEIPAIGIGAGPGVDGQVLVLQDMLGMNREFHPKFLRRFADGEATVREAVNRYCAETIAGSFPGESESYT